MEENEMIEEKPYKFRLLGASDVFLMFTIISKIGINEFTNCIESGSLLNVVSGMTEEEKESENGAILAAATVFLEVTNVIFAKLHTCEKEIYQLLSQTSNLSVEEISAPGNAAMFLEMLIDFFKKEEFMDFFKVVSKLFK